MSTEKLDALQSGMDSKPTAQGTIALGVDESRTPRIPEELSILPVRSFVVFPGTVIPLNVQRAASLKLLDDTLPRTKVIGLLTQRDETRKTRRLKICTQSTRLRSCSNLLGNQRITCW